MSHRPAVGSWLADQPLPYQSRDIHKGARHIVLYDPRRVSYDPQHFRKVWVMRHAFS